MIDEQIERAECEQMAAEFYSGNFAFDSAEEYAEALEALTQHFVDKRAEARAQGAKLTKQAVIAELDAMRERVSGEEFGR